MGTLAQLEQLPTLAAPHAAGAEPQSTIGDSLSSRRAQLEADMSASAAAAFHRWRYARLKTSFGRQLQQILSEVAADEQHAQGLQDSLQQQQLDKQLLMQRLAQLQADNQRLARQVQGSAAEQSTLQAALDQARGSAKLLEVRAARAEHALAAEARHHRSQLADLRSQLDAVSAERDGCLQTQQLLLARLTAHDLEVAQASHQAADKQAAEAQHHDAILRMEAIVRATGERAAAAEADLAAKSEACAALQLLMAELAGLTVAEAAALQERAAGAEQLKQQLVQMHATVSGLEATRQQMQQAADRLSVELAAERECSRALRAGQALRDAIVQALDDPPGQDAARIIERLGTELDVKVEEVAQLAAKLAAMETLGRQLERQSGTETRVKELQDQVCALQLQLASAPPTHISVTTHLEAQPAASQPAAAAEVHGSHRGRQGAATPSRDMQEVTGRLREAEAEVQRLHITSAALRKVLEERPAGAASAEGRAASLSPQKARIAAFGHNKPPAPGGAANAAMLDALADAERRCKEAASGRAEAVQQLQGERDLWRAARDVFVDRVLDLHAYAGSKVLLQTAFAGWRLHLSEAKLAGLEAALQTSQGQAQRAITSIAKRSAALHTYLEGQLQFWEGQALSEVLLHWRLQMAQQASQRHRWQALALGLLQIAQPTQPQATVAWRLLRLHQAQQNGAFVQRVLEARLVAVCFSAWSAAAKLGAQQVAWQRATDRIEALTQALPVWIQRIGQQRALERAWLLWRTQTLTDARAARSANARVSLPDNDENAAPAQHSNRPQPEEHSGPGKPAWRPAGQALQQHKAQHAQRADPTAQEHGGDALRQIQQTLSRELQAFRALLAQDAANGAVHEGHGSPLHALNRQPLSAARNPRGPAHERSPVKVAFLRTLPEGDWVPEDPGQGPEQHHIQQRVRALQAIMDALSFTLSEVQTQLVASKGSPRKAGPTHLPVVPGQLPAAAQTLYVPWRPIAQSGVEPQQQSENALEHTRPEQHGPAPAGSPLHDGRLEHTRPATATAAGPVQQDGATEQSRHSTAEPVTWLRPVTPRALPPCPSKACVPTAAAAEPGAPLGEQAPTIVSADQSRQEGALGDGCAAAQHAQQASQPVGDSRAAPAHIQQRPTPSSPALVGGAMPAALSGKGKRSGCQPAQRRSKRASTGSDPASRKLATAGSVTSGIAAAALAIPTRQHASSAATVAALPGTTQVLSSSAGADPSTDPALLSYAGDQPPLADPNTYPALTSHAEGNPDTPQPGAGLPQLRPQPAELHTAVSRDASAQAAAAQPDCAQPPETAPSTVVNAPDCTPQAAPFMDPATSAASQTAAFAAQAAVYGLLAVAHPALPEAATAARASSSIPAPMSGPACSAEDSIFDMDAASPGMQQRDGLLSATITESVLGCSTAQVSTSPQQPAPAVLEVPEEPVASTAPCRASGTGPSPLLQADAQTAVERRQLSAGPSMPQMNLRSDHQPHSSNTAATAAAVRVVMPTLALPQRQSNDAPKRRPRHPSSSSKGSREHKQALKPWLPPAFGAALSPKPRSAALATPPSGAGSPAGGAHEVRHPDAAIAPAASAGPTSPAGAQHSMLPQHAHREPWRPPAFGEAASPKPPAGKRHMPAAAGACNQSLVVRHRTLSQQHQADAGLPSRPQAHAEPAKCRRKPKRVPAVATLKTILPGKVPVVCPPSIRRRLDLAAAQKQTGSQI